MLRVSIRSVVWRGGSFITRSANYASGGLGLNQTISPIWLTSEAIKRTTGSTWVQDRGMRHYMNWRWDETVHFTSATWAFAPSCLTASPSVVLGSVAGSPGFKRVLINWDGRFPQPPLSLTINNENKTDIFMLTGTERKINHNSWNLAPDKACCIWDV